MQIPKNFAWTLFRESAAPKYFAWTKFRENGQNTRKSRKLIHAKFNPLKVFWSKTVKTAYRPHPARHHLEIASFWEKQLLNHDLHLKVSHCAKFQPITQSSSAFMAI